MGAFLQETSIPNDGTLAVPGCDRDPKNIITQAVCDPIYDVTCLPLTYTNSRWFAFVYRADEKDLKRILPEPMKLEDDVVEFWYVDHEHTMLGPYLEMGVTISASYEGYKAGYYPYMYLSSDAGVFAGREPFGFPKKLGRITCLEHGGKKDNGYESKGNEFFSFMLERWGYLIHTATGHYSSNKISDLPAVPMFYGKQDWGRFNYRVMTSPDVAKTEYNLTYLDSKWEGYHRFQLKMDTVKVATKKDIRTWFLAATPFDNMGGLCPVKELIGLVSFNFDLIIPPASIVWKKEVTRTPEEILKYAVQAEPAYKYSMRMRYPMPIGI